MLTVADISLEPAVQEELQARVRSRSLRAEESWLNQVELWFSKIERDVIARGIFTSVKDLSRKLMRYIRLCNKDPKPIKWMYRDPERRIAVDSNSTVTGH